MEYRQMALEFLCATHPREKRRPPTELDRQEHVQMGTLRYLLEHGSVASPAQLIEFFGFSHARLTKILTELERKGMILRDNDPTDRRRVIVRLTEEGYAFALCKREEMVGQITDMLRLLGQEDAEHLLRIVGKLSNGRLSPLPPVSCDF